MAAQYARQSCSLLSCPVESASPTACMWHTLAARLLLLLCTRRDSTRAAHSPLLYTLLRSISSCTHAAGGTGGSFMCSCAAMRMFSGFRSVCTRPSSWM